MRIEEMTIIKVTPPNKKRRTETDHWSKHPELTKGIQECLATGKEQMVFGRGELAGFVIRPTFPLIEEAMRKPENQDIEKVSITVMFSAFHLAVRRDKDGGQGPVTVSPESQPRE